MLGNRHLNLNTTSLQCVESQFLFTAPVPADMNITRPCAPPPCDPGAQCSVYGGQVAMCDPCSGPGSIYNLLCRPECLAHSDCQFNLACLGRKCLDPCPGSCGVNANCVVINHNPVCSCPTGLVGNPFEHCSTLPPSKYAKRVWHINAVWNE
jgi:hypothetical protein